MGDKFGANFSGTAQHNEVVAALRNATVRGVASTAGTAAGFNRVAQAMLDSRGRKALLTLAKFPPGARQSNDALAYLATVMAVSAPKEPGLSIDIVGGSPTLDEQAQGERERQDREKWLHEQQAAGRL